MTTSWPVDTYRQASYRVECEQGCAVVVASGEIDLYTAPDLRRALDEAARLSSRVVVDLTDVDFIDSAGLGVVLRARDRAHLLSLSLAHPPRTLRKVMRLTSLGDTLPVYPSRQDATEGAEHAHPM